MRFISNQLAFLAVILLLMVAPNMAFAQAPTPGGPGVKTCNGRWINPISDVCWSCMLPIRFAGIPIMKGKIPDPGGAPSGICACATPFPRIGIPISYWDPHRVADVTSEAWCFPNLGGLKMNVGFGAQDGVFQKDHSSRPSIGLQHVHYYSYPLLIWMDLLGTALCLEGSSFDILYMTEVDPLWNDDELASIINPEAAVFANPIADAACVADCVAATVKLPLKQLFWCAGCQGSMYPMTGHSTNKTQVSNTFHVLEKFMFKLHRQLLAKGTIGTKALCRAYLMPIIDKTMYRFQMTMPSPHVKKSDQASGGPPVAGGDGTALSSSGNPLGLGAYLCPRIGGSTMMWDSNKITPYKGEDVGYLIWRRRDCCAL